MSQFKIIRQAWSYLTETQLAQLIGVRLYESPIQMNVFKVIGSPPEWTYITWDRQLMVSADGVSWSVVTDPAKFWPDLLKDQLDLNKVTA